MKLLKLIFASILAVVFGGPVFAKNIEDLLPLHGNEYVAARDKVLDSGIQIKEAGMDHPRMALMTEILNERTKHPELFKKLSDMVKKCTAPQPPRETRQSSPLPYISLTGAAASLMRQGIEKKEYVTNEVTKESAPYMVEVKHIQTDDEVARAKELNRAARLAVIEYLWKISEDWRVDYELSDIFALSSKEYVMPYLPVFADVFQRSTHFLVLENCAKIFINANYSESLPLLKGKIDQCFGEKQYLSCLVILPAIERFGDKSDAEKMDELLENIANNAKIERGKSDWIFDEIQRQIEVHAQAGSSQNTGLRLD
jgi:hypothetical protein